jgi:hypothetical protein
MSIVDGRVTDMERCLRHGHAGMVPSVLVALAVEEMFVSDTGPETEPHAVHSSMREK